MKIGDLPEATSITGQYKVAAENTSGSAKSVQAVNLVKGALGSVPISYVTGSSAIFSTYDYTDITVAYAQMAGFGKFRQLRLQIKTKNAIAVPSDGRVYMTCGQVLDKFKPVMLTFGILQQSGGTVSGIVQLDTDGSLKLQHFDKGSSSYTIAADTYIYGNIEYLCDGTM